MSCYYILRSADVAQSVERRLGKAEVTGPIPVISLKKEIGSMPISFLTYYRSHGSVPRHGERFVDHKRAMQTR